MERLEAALQKARAERKAVKLAARKSAPRPVEPPAAVQSWAALKEFKMSPRTARANRITTLVPGKNSAPYDMLRSRVVRIMSENDWKTLAITSPNVACGKTTVCANLAISLARNEDLRILVLDLDLRRPALHKVVGYRPAKNLHSVLQGEVPAAEQLVRLGNNVAFGLNFRPAPNPAELLQSRKSHERLAQLQAEFQPDITIYDMPPMLVADDYVGLLPRVDSALLVAAADSTTIPQLDSCEKELADLTNVMGVVLNKCRYRDEASSYDYNYGGYY